MISSSVLWISILTAVVGLVAGFQLHQIRIRRVEKRRKQIPSEWPLEPRVLANSEEHAAWMWLCAAFMDHHVMLKLPVTRFTLPQRQSESKDWYALLNGVYCTFTICTAEGRVIGCVDLADNKQITRNNRILKQTLLAQCGIAYWTLKSGYFPATAEIRTGFIGEDAALGMAAKSEIEREKYRAEIIAMRLKLSTVVAQRRRSRDAASSIIQRSHDAAHACDEKMGPVSEFDSQWTEQNSFIAPLDSRRGGLC